MEILRNILFKCQKVTFFEEGSYRILDIFGNEEVCIFNLNGNTAKPQIVQLYDLQKLIEDKTVIQLDENLPTEIFSEDHELTQENLAFRDENYRCIKNLVENSKFLWEYSVARRSKIVINHANEINVSFLKISRALVKYWSYGQVLNSLLMFTSKCGGRGKQKTASSTQRGRPVSKGMYGLRDKESVNVTAIDKINIRAEILNQLSVDKNFSYTLAYDFFKKNYYSEEIETAFHEGRSIQVPSLSQFRYWGKALVSKEEMRKRQVSLSKWKKDYEGFEGSVSEKITAPGMRYELDSTIADVYIVGEFNRQMVLGRPTLYTVIDTASRMIVGLHISMEYASWQAARQAIFNACMPKVEYCKRHGVSIEHKDWPCSGVPARILCDRGEMIGLNPEQLVNKLGTTLEFAPPYRGDCKSIVERRFGIANEVIHNLPGTTLGELRERGETDTRLNAALTISAFTQTIIRLFLEHNNERLFDRILTRELVEANLKYSPLNYWNLYTDKYQHALKKISEHNFIARLMKPGMARVREDGILFNGLRYSCERSTLEEWTTKALNSGTWKVECRFDESWTTNIYIREKAPLNI